MIEIAGQRRLQGLSGALLRWGSIAIIGYHLYGAQFGLPEAQKFRPMHVAMYCAMIFLAYGWRRGDRRTSVPWWDWGLFALAWVPVVYIYFDYSRIAYERISLIEPLLPMDWIAGVLAMVLVAEACRRTVGLTLVVLLGDFRPAGLVWALFPRPVRFECVDADAPGRSLVHDRDRPIRLDH